VVSSSRLVFNHNTVGLDVSGVLFIDLVDSQDFSISSLKLVQESDLIPEFRSGDDFVGGEDSHGDDFWVGVLLRRVSSGRNEILVNFHLETRISLDHFLLKCPADTELDMKPFTLLELLSLPRKTISEELTLFNGEVTRSNSPLPNSSPDLLKEDSEPPSSPEDPLPSRNKREI